VVKTGSKGARERGSKGARKLVSELASQLVSTSAGLETRTTAGQETGATKAYSLSLEEVDGLREVGDADVAGEGGVLALQG
jgi:hypothetical protein